jgi:RNase P subunit RPR2
MTDKLNIPGYEGYYRINYLFQAAVTVFSTNPKLSQLYVYEMKQLAEKLVVRL